MSEIFASQLTERSLTFGEKLVGIDFNPASDPLVDHIKILSAGLADEVNGYYNSIENDPLTKLLFEQTIAKILDAQMFAVKLATFKY